MSAALLALASLTSLLLLGAVQGATEFLPVSSSGHLVLMREWMGLESGGLLTREIALHFGTFVAVAVFCRGDLRALFAPGSAGLWRLVLGASLVTAALGIPLKGVVEKHLNDLVPAGCGLLVTSLLLVVVSPRDERTGTRRITQGTLRDALVMGLFQSLALAPGVSRAGATIVGALLLGYSRPDAVRIAFLISIPAVGGAVLLEALDGEALVSSLDAGLLAAMGLACVVGLGALRFLSVRVDARSLRLFGLYTFLLGWAAILSA